MKSYNVEFSQTFIFQSIFNVEFHLKYVMLDRLLFFDENIIKLHILGHLEMNNNFKISNES